MHGSPGPLVAGLVPASFLAGNVMVLAALTVSKEVRAVNAASKLLASYWSLMSSIVSVSPIFPC
jgi:hypothetical protein